MTAFSAGTRGTPGSDLPLGPGAVPLSEDTALFRNQLRVLDIAQAFFQADILTALLRFQVFERLDDGEKTGAEIAAIAGTRPDIMTRLLEGGRMLKLLEAPDGVHYRLTPLSRSVLAPSAGENYLGNWIRNLDYFRSAFSRLGDAIQTGGPVMGTEGHLGGDQGQTREFTLAMHNYATGRGKEFAETLDTTGCRSMLDVGSGPGTYSFHLGLRHPELELNLLDLPFTLEVAREVGARYPLKNRIHYHPLDALKDEIPGSYDIVLVSNILHMLGEAASRSLIERLYRNVAPGGSLIIQSMYLEEPSPNPPQRWPVIVDLLNLCMHEGGRNIRVSETQGWMEEAGFTRVEYRQMKLFNVNSFLRGYRT